VGLGTADQQMKLQGVQLLLNEQKQLSQVPGLVSPANFYASAAKLAEAVGFKSPEQFFSQPQQQGPQIPPQVQAALQQAQQEIQQLQQALQQAQSGEAVKRMELESRERIEAAKLQMQAAINAQQDDLKRDLAELAGAVSLLSKQIQPPASLGAAVEQDLAESNGQA
jgi:biopolymer transport protein ExbB/TolQ